MILAIPAAIQAVKGASLAVKIGAIVAVVALILGAGFYAGSRWEEAKTLKVQAAFDKFVSDSTIAAEKQIGEVKLENQRLRNAKEIADEQNLRARNSLQHYSDRLRELSEKSSRASYMPRPPASTTRPEFTCFDRAELDAADANYRAGQADIRARIHALVGKGAEAVVDLDTAKEWALKLPQSK